MIRIILPVCLALALTVPAGARQKGTRKKSPAPSAKSQAKEKRSDGDEEVRREVVNGELYEGVFKNGWRISSKKCRLMVVEY